VVRQSSVWVGSPSQLPARRGDPPQHHLGFDVKNLDEFERRIAFLTDPWRTYIEVTEKLAPEVGSATR
jgi:hypothetical protein